VPNLEQLFANNRAWSKSLLDQDPNFFKSLAAGQHPKYLWIGCADSRVPANEILGLKPGEVFVHRNIANLMIHTDLNALSVLEYAVEVLRVEHIIVCGHYGCGGIRAALHPRNLGLIDHWLQHIVDIRVKYEEKFKKLNDDEQQHLLCELNVNEQMQHVCRTSVVQRAWKEGRLLVIHGWVYALSDGLLQETWQPISKVEQIPATYRMEIE
jgi:carbonic anhydrase